MMGTFFRPARFEAWTRALGQPAPSVPDSTVAEIGRAVDRAVSALGTEIEAAKTEADWVSPDTVQVEPEKSAQIGIVGGALSPEEIRTVVIMDSQELGALAARMRTGPLTHYLTPAQASALDALAADTAKLKAYEETQNPMGFSPEHVGLAAAHIQSHVAAVKPLLEAAERLVVSGEAPAVPVREPYEKGPTTLEIAVGAGVLAVAGVLLWQLFG